MKKKRIELFPEMKNFNFLADDEYELRLEEFSPGKVYRIGKPSDAYYKFISSFIVPDKANLKVPSNFNKIEGLIVRVISMLQMASGNVIAVLRRYDDELFLKKFEKVFLQVEMGIASKEIVPLDLETKHILESDVSDKSQIAQK